MEDLITNFLIKILMSTKARLTNSRSPGSSPQQLLKTGTCLKSYKTPENNYYLWPLTCGRVKCTHWPTQTGTMLTLLASQLKDVILKQFLYLLPLLQISRKKNKKKQTFCLLEGEWIVLVHKTETVFLALLEHTGHSFTAFIAAHYGKIINCVALTQSTDKRTLSVHPADILQYKSLLQGPHPLSWDPDPS